MRSEEWWKGRIKLYSAPIPSFYKKGLGRNHLFLQVFFLCIILRCFQILCAATFGISDREKG